MPSTYSIVLWSIALIALVVIFWGKRPNVSFNWRPVVLVLVLGAIAWYGREWIVQQFKDDPPTTAQSTTLTRYTRLMVDRFTPVDDSINYEAEYDTQGDPVVVSFRTIRGDTSFVYSGKGELHFPPLTRVKGLVHFIPPDPSRQARVRIWRVEYH